MRDDNEFKYHSFTKENLINILETLKKYNHNNDFDDFAEWCHSFWSNWRSDNEGLFHRTEEVTIDIVMEVFDCKISRIDISKEQIEEWLVRLY